MSWSASWPAMGGTVEVTTDAWSWARAEAYDIVSGLERRWSRFRADSELSQLNAASGPVLVDPATATLVDTALAGSRLTRGWFDPTRGAELHAAGYRAGCTGDWVEREPVPSRSGSVWIDAATGFVHVPAGIELDLGGIAKGWTADVVASVLRERGATHAAVGVGGDLRVSASAPTQVEIAAPDDSTEPTRVIIRDGGVAVSGPSRRRSTDGRHHLIDPHRGVPAERPRHAAVIAASAAGAEILATAAAVAPLSEAVTIIESSGATAWLTESDGTVTSVGQPERFLFG